MDKNYETDQIEELCADAMPLTNEELLPIALLGNVLVSLGELGVAIVVAKQDIHPLCKWALVTTLAANASSLIRNYTNKLYPKEIEEVSISEPVEVGDDKHSPSKSWHDIYSGEEIEEP